MSWQYSYDKTKAIITDDEGYTVAHISVTKNTTAHDDIVKNVRPHTALEFDMKLANCNEHPDENNPSLPCWAIRHDDGKRVTTDELWQLVQQKSR